MSVALDPAGTARTLSGLAGAATALPFPRALAERLERGELGAASLSLAWELARLADEPIDGPAALLVLWMLLDASRLGSTAIDLAQSSRLLDRAKGLTLDPGELLTLKRGLELAASGALLTRLVGAQGERRPLVLEGSRLALARHVDLEHRLAGALARRANDRASLPRPGVAALEGALEPSGARAVRLTEEQRAAVRAAVDGRQVVIAGGPGTGKTSIVASIVRALGGGAAPVVPPASVALAAPTGKAADRLFAALSDALVGAAEGEALLAALAPATTLHRLLGYRAHDDTFTFHAKNPLPHRLVIVDEASMLDLSLSERLLASLAPDARLVLLGDPDQLPSVDAGAVLGDLVGSDADGARVVPVVRLTRSHRVDATDPGGAHVLAVAASMRIGELGPVRTIEGVAAAVDHALGVGVFSPGEADWSRFVRGWLERAIRPILNDATEPLDLERAEDRERAHRLFAALGRERLLTLTRGAGRRTGSDAVNLAFARELHGGRSGSTFAAGEPLLAVRNDYDRELMNGDQGLVLRVGAGSSTSAMLAGVFLRAGRLVVHPLESVRGSVERAYATTVHKAQGSEHERVVLLLPDEDLPLLAGRELVYTAVTRARRGVLIVGSPPLLERAVKRASHRVTGLRSALARNGQASAGD